jgi:predicted phosphodiesterase
MRIVAVADTHLYHRELEVPDGDVFVHAGDMCRGGSLEEFGRAARWICGLPHAVKLVIAGNHDWCFVRQPAEARALLAAGGVHYLEGDEVSAGGLRVWGGPWQPEFGGWAFNLPRGPALAEKWAAIPEGLDLLITHGPPEGFGDRSWHASRTGCVDLRARVDLVRPKLHLFGHNHEDGGAWTQGGTTFINCTTWECERAATVIDLDLVGRTMTVEAPPARPPRRE